MSNRGVNDGSSSLVTTSLTGQYETDVILKNNFLASSLAYRSHAILDCQPKSVTPVRGAWCSSQRPQTPDLGPGKVAGKVLRFDLWARFAKLVI